MTERRNLPFLSSGATVAALLLCTGIIFGRQTVDLSKKPITLPGENRITTDHLSVIVGPASASAAAGGKVSLTLDVKPRPGVHVYAPGNENYLPIELHVDPQPNITIAPTTFPPPEDFYFKPLDEHVKVYEKPFRLVQDVTLSGSPAARKALKVSGTVSVSGVFEYQACDDRVCFAPKKVPIVWTIRVKEPAL